MLSTEKKLRRKASVLRDKVVLLAREIEAQFGKDDDRTIFARNAYCELLTELDPMMNEPKLYGLILSDLLDHIAAAYGQSAGRDPRDVRYEIFKVMRDEDRFKVKDSSCGGSRGTTIKPPRN